MTTTKLYSVENTNSGLDLGVYPAASPEAAVAAMLADAGHVGEPSPALVARELSPHDALAHYADEHTADCGGDRARALREMSDEPGEVAAAVGLTSAEVLAWIGAQG